MLHSAQQDNVDIAHASKAFIHGRQISRKILDDAMADANVEFVLGPGDSGLYDLAANAGYPIGTMPLSKVEYAPGQSRPEGVCIIAKEGAESRMLDFMVRYEQIVPGRPVPKSFTGVEGVLPK